MLPRFWQISGIVFLGFGLADGYFGYQGVLAARRWEQSLSANGSGDTHVILHDTHVTQFGLPWWLLPLLLLVLGLGCGVAGMRLSKKIRSA